MPKPDPGKVRATLDEKGHEVLPDVKFAVPAVMGRRDNLGDRVRELIRSEQLRRQALEAGYESFEEADDFDIEDDPIDPSTPYEEVFEGDIAVDARARAAEDKARRKKADDARKEEEFANRLKGMSRAELDKLLGTRKDKEPEEQD